MKKIISIALLLFTWTPYLFLATAVDEVQRSNRSYDCTVQSAGRIKKVLAFSSVYYSPIRNTAYLKGGNMVLPIFLLDEEVFTARCGFDAFNIGAVDFVKPGDKIHIHTMNKLIKIFGIVLANEEDIVMFGSGWVGDTEGQTISTVLIDGKEVKMFNGRIVE